jgi:RNA polymerase sigma factor (TIGR02999 family)
MSGDEVTQLLNKAAGGDRAAQDYLAVRVYDELRRLAAAQLRRESPGHSVQATVLVNDAFLRLVGDADIAWESRSHFFGLASRVMRQVLVDHARARRREKRGGEARRVSFDEALTVSVADVDDVLRVDEALRALEANAPQHAEIVTMRFFGGMSMEAVADSLGMSKRTAEREWAVIKAWLRRELSR